MKFVNLVSGGNYTIHSRRQQTTVHSMLTIALHGNNIIYIIISLSMLQLSFMARFTFSYTQHTHTQHISRTTLILTQMTSNNNKQINSVVTNNKTNIN